MLSLVYDQKSVRKKLRGNWVVPLARLEAHYLLNDCFLPKNYIISNARRIKNIPTSIVHGRYDFVCTPDMAFKLHKALPKSNLQFVTAGHSSGDPEIVSHLMDEMARIAKKY